MNTNIIKEKRLQRGYTLREAARLSGLDNGVIGALESGRRKLTPYYANALAKAYNCSPSEFITDYYKDITDEIKKLLEVKFNRYDKECEGSDIEYDRLICISIIMGLSDDYVERAYQVLRAVEGHDEFKEVLKEYDEN